MRATVAELEGAYALAVVSEQDPERLIVAREGCPVVLGLGVEENFVASDVAALLPVTRRFMFLEEGDVAEMRRKAIRVTGQRGQHVERQAGQRAVGGCRREGPVPALHAQGDPRAAARRGEHAAGAGRQRPAARSSIRPGRNGGLQATENVHIVACGTSYHAGLVARYFIEQICGALHGGNRQRIPLSQSGGAARIRCL